MCGIWCTREHSLVTVNLSGTLQHLRVLTVEPGLTAPWSSCVPHRSRFHTPSTLVIFNLASAASAVICLSSSELLNWKNSRLWNALTRQKEWVLGWKAWQLRAGTSWRQRKYPPSGVRLGRRTPLVTWRLLSHQCLVHHHASILLLWKLKMADFSVLRVVHEAVFVVHFRKVTTSVKRWTRVKRNQMCVFGMQYFCITNSYILTHINPMICEFCQLLLCLLNQIQ